MTTVTLPGGTIELTEDGPVGGPAVLLFHGFMVDERLWDPIVPTLAAAGLRVVRPTLPIGSHRIPLATSPTPRGVAHLVADLIEQLDLDDVTLVGNDSGGAMSQLLLSERPERVGRLVLTNCDTADNFPPFPFNLLGRLAARRANRRGARRQDIRHARRARTRRERDHRLHQRAGGGVTSPLNERV